MKRRTRQFAALFAILAMCFAPLVMAFHACPGVADHASARDSAPCHGGIPDAGAVCERHCNEAKVAGDVVKPLPAIDLSRENGLRVRSIEHLPRAATDFAGERFSAAQAPPLARFTVLRL